MVPTQKVEWLCILWNSQLFSLSIPDRRISDLLCSITHIIDFFPVFTARELAQVTGKVISLSPVVGNLTRLMTRHCYMSIETRSCWDNNLFLVYPSEIFRELYFWRDKSYRPSSVVMYSAASNIACGAYSVEIESKFFHKMFNDIQNSTWREMRAIEQALSFFKLQFSGKTLKWYTDNQNCLRIVQAGSMKEPLQSLAYSIFSICTKRSISIDIQWIPRKENPKADYISKMVDHEIEYMLKGAVLIVFLVQTNLFLLF